MGWNIVEFYLGNISEATLMERLKADATDNTSLAEASSETNFYLGKVLPNPGDLDSTMALFKLAVANNVHNFVEHRYALLNYRSWRPGPGHATWRQNWTSNSWRTSARSLFCHHLHG